MDCNKCHGGKSLAGQCLICHEEIQAQLSRQHGYHAHLLKGQKPECAHCHSEHNGENFPLVNNVSWEEEDPKKFSHQHTDFRLEGRHIVLACEQCHRGALKKPFSLPKFPSMPRKNTFLGLTQACMDCHKDIHAGGLAANCRKCHGQNAWKPTLPTLFDHEKFFSLKGVHAKISCAKCHVIPRLGEPVRASKDFPFDKSRGKKCGECHKNPHRANWRVECETCHSGSVPWSAATAKLDASPLLARKYHSDTIFPLTAPHEKAACVKCHNPKLKFKQKYPDSSQPGYRRQKKYCETCHTHDLNGPRPQDPHGMQFTARHAHCYDCHSERGFKPGIYGVKEHAAVYPLVGGHRAKSKCSDCHVPQKNSEEIIYVGTPWDCASCHSDIHFGQFRKSDGSTRCQDCHTDFGAWKKTTFNHNKQSRFKLDSAHINVACKDCHPLVTLRNQKKTIQYKPLRMECQDCHDFK